MSIPSVRVVVVSFSDPAATALAVASALAQEPPPGEVVVVDNGRSGASFDGAELRFPGANLGFAGGTLLGAAGASSDWLLLLNPDCVMLPGSLAKLLEAALDGPGIGAVGAQVLLPDGSVNAGDNPVHLTGIAWAGNFGGAPEESPPREVAAVSGAAMLVSRAAWEEVGGFDSDFFLYHEDVDLCLRLRLAGWSVLFQPAAHVQHSYEFGKGPDKWFYLERNRIRTVTGVFSARTLSRMVPLLIGAEFLVFAKALSEGWAREKARSWFSNLSCAGKLVARRRRIQRTRRVPDTRILELMTDTYSSPASSGLGISTLAPFFRTYRNYLIRGSR